MIRNTSRTLCLLLPGAILALAGCRSSTTHPAESPSTTEYARPTSEAARAEISNEFTATAQVAAVDHAKRLLTLRREDGGLLEVEVGEAARNFDQIAVGDTVRVRYEETLTAEKLPPGEALRPAEGAVTAALAQAGAKPGGGVGMALSVPVKIESIDLPRSIVVFSLSSGELIAHRVGTSEGRAFLQGLAVGDTVRLDYTEALALGVEEL